MKTIKAKSLQQSCHIAIVVSRFNHEVTERLLHGAQERLKALNFPSENVTVVWVPGAVEIPLIAKRLAGQARYQVIICLGAVIRGETSHYDYVCDQVSQGCQKIALEYDIPVIFGVLTTEDEDQAFARAGGAFGNKGSDAVDAALEMISV